VDDKSLDVIILIHFDTYFQQL